MMTDVRSSTRMPDKAGVAGAKGASPGGALPFAPAEEAGRLLIIPVSLPHIGFFEREWLLCRSEAAGVAAAVPAAPA
jgi:hypothetical protein